MISPQTVSPEINATESRQGTAIAEYDYSPEESGGYEADESAFAKILSSLLKNNQDEVPVSGNVGPERPGSNRFSPETSGPTGKRVGRKELLEKIGSEEDAGAADALFRNKKPGLLENFPELDEENALSAAGLLLSRLDGEQNSDLLAEIQMKLPAEEIPSEGSFLLESSVGSSEEEAWAVAMAWAGSEGEALEGEIPALEGFFDSQEIGVQGAEGVDAAAIGAQEDVAAHEAAAGSFAGETAAVTQNAGAAAEVTAGEEGGPKDNKGRDRRGFRGIVDDMPNFRRPENDSPFTGIKKPALVDGGNDRKERLGETKNRDKRRDRVSLEVQDLRNVRGEGAQAIGESSHADEARPLGGSQETELTVELRQDNRGSEPASTGGEKTASQAFEDILARELHQNLNGDIVRHASVVLKDGGEGTIRLSLKPESLGNVKIRLEMADNKITGHIVVESDEALRAFEREVSSLEQAFKESGFEGADLEMSLSSGNGGAGQRQEGEASPFFSERFAAGLAASQYDASLERMDTTWAGKTANGLKPGNGQISVNMLI
jgi:hypothetical protein